MVHRLPEFGIGMRSGAVACGVVRVERVCTAQGQSQHGEGRWATS